MISVKNLKKKAALTVVTAAMSAAMLGMTVFAASGTIKSSNVNVRSDASTSGSVVGTVTTGDSFEVGEPVQDASGMDWYQITLSSGATGYVRSDFIDVVEDVVETPEEGTETPEGTEAEAAADPSSTDTGDYQIVLAPDENGEKTYYLYNNAAGARMKLSDIEKLQGETKEAQEQAAAVKSRYRIIVIVLGVLLAAAVIALVLLFLRLRDAMTNGRKERDLFQERKDARRTNANADGINTLRRGERPARPGQNPADRRNDAYASGARRVAAGDRGTGAPVRTYRGDDARPVREADGTRRAPAPGRRPVAPGAAPARDGAPVRRPIGDAPAREAVRRPEGARPAAPVRDGAQQGGPAPRPVRPQEGGAQRPSTAARRPQPKNFAEDDDFDYDFISLDDDQK